MRLFKFVPLHKREIFNLPHKFELPSTFEFYFLEYKTRENGFINSFVLDLITSHNLHNSHYQGEFNDAPSYRFVENFLNIFILI